MADGTEREAKFKDAALVLAVDAVCQASKVKHYIGAGQYERAEALATQLQRTARDTKWLMQRQPKE